MGVKERILTIRLLDKLNSDATLVEKMKPAGEVDAGGKLCNESKA